MDREEAPLDSSRWTHRRVARTLWVLGVAFIVGVGVLFYEPSRTLSRREVTLKVEEVALAASGPAADRVGDLSYVGGLAIRSQDEGFGGLSGLMMDVSDPETRIIAVSDQGDRFGARLVIEGGRLRGLDHATLEPLVDLDGLALRSKKWSDAESIAQLPDGRVLTGFERHHRIWVYGARVSGPARVFETPAALQDAPSNGGLESIATWPDGRVLAITERLRTAGSKVAAFLWEAGRWSSLEWTVSGPGFEPSDAATLPNGDLLVLERLWSPLGPSHFRTRIVRVKGGDVSAGAVLSGKVIAELRAPLITENFEGLAVHKGEGGVTRLLLVSDDNFTRAQRTLLLMFELRE